MSLWHKYRKNKLAVFGLGWIVLCILISLFAYVIAPDNSANGNDIQLLIALQKPGFKVEGVMIKKEKPTEQNIFAILLNGKEPEFEFKPIKKHTLHQNTKTLEYAEYTTADDTTHIYHTVLFDKLYNINAPTKTNHYILGTDRFGRDLLSRLLIGARVSLSVGFIAVSISLLLGLVLGLLAGYYRGSTDYIISWLINVIWSLPTLLIVVSITLALGKGFWQVFVAVGLTMWVEVARVVRGQVFSIREKEYIEAARTIGASNTRIIFKHILPNVTGPLVVICAANFATAILLEAGLSFLGLGVQPPEPSWGMMIKEHYNYVVMDHAYLAMVPGLAIMFLVMAFNYVGMGLRDVWDVKG